MGERVGEGLEEMVGPNYREKVINTYRTTHLLLEMTGVGGGV